MLGHHIIIYQYAVMSTRRHPIDQPIRFDRGLSGVALPPDDQPLILAPLGRLRLWLGIEDVREPRLELLIVFQFLLDLSEECFCRWSVVG